jgi:hypothetical protein
MRTWMGSCASEAVPCYAADLVWKATEEGCWTSCVGSKLHRGGGAIELEKYSVCIYNGRKMRLEVDGQLPFGSPVARRCGVVGLQSESFAGEAACVAPGGMADRPSSPGEAAAATPELERYGNGAI